MATAELVNPFREGLRLEGATHPCQLVIFGASGDLTKRKLLPAIYNLAQASLLPPSFAMIGFARAQMTDEQFRALLREAVAASSEVRVRDESALASLAERCYYVSGDFHDAAAFQVLKNEVDTLEKRYGTGGSRIFYTATPASLYGSITEQLHSCGLTKAGGGPQSFVRIIVEKPFGHDLATAKQLNAELLAYLSEDQIYRIDHYLGKETVQNILVLRFANSIFEPLFNQKYVDHVQITVAESEGVGTRAGYYDESGALRDMVQNHLLQLLSLVAMEPPRSLDANVIRDEKLAVLLSLRPLTSEDVDRYVVRAQYGAGFDMGRPAPGYRQESGVNPASRTETFVALQLFVDNWRW